MDNWTNIETPEYWQQLDQSVYRPYSRPIIEDLPLHGNYAESDPV